MNEDLDYEQEVCDLFRYEACYKLNAFQAVVEELWDRDVANLAQSFIDKVEVARDLGDWAEMGAELRMLRRAAWDLSSEEWFEFMIPLACIDEIFEAIDYEKFPDLD